MSGIDGRGLEAEALVTDRYLDALLASADARLGPAPDHPADALDRAVRLASRRLTRDLPRFHPSFRFEERLAARLAEAAAAMRLPLAAGQGSRVVTLPYGQPGGFDPLADPLANPLADPRATGRRADAGGDAADAEGAAADAAAVDAATDGHAAGLTSTRIHATGVDADPRRPLLVGGAVAASAISLAGAAWLAWRRGHARPSTQRQA